MNLWEMALAVFIGWAGGFLGLFLLHRRTYRKQQERRRPKPRKPKDYDDDDATQLQADAADSDAAYRLAVHRAKRALDELRARRELFGDSLGIDDEPGGDPDAGD